MKSLKILGFIFNKACYVHNHKNCSSLTVINLLRNQTPCFNHHFRVIREKIRRNIFFRNATKAHFTLSKERPILETPKLKYAHVTWKSYYFLHANFILALDNFLNILFSDKSRQSDIWSYKRSNMMWDSLKQYFYWRSEISCEDPLPEVYSNVHRKSDCQVPADSLVTFCLTFFVLNFF